MLPPAVSFTLTDSELFWGMGRTELGKRRGETEDGTGGGFHHWILSSVRLPGLTQRPSSLPGCPLVDQPSYPQAATMSVGCSSSCFDTTAPTGTQHHRIGLLVSEQAGTVHQL